MSCNRRFEISNWKGQWTTKLQELSIPNKHSLQMLQLPKSFRICSTKEARLLEYIASYQRRFNQLHPERRLFMFAALNECNVEKCICTTIRPSHSDYIELYHWQSCASFIADFLAYEPLEDPLMFPSFLPSPVSVLSWQRADCFDFAVVLVSFLTGAGYEAFCVVGYAPLHITTNSQEAIVCPYIALREKEEKEEAHKEKENQIPTQKTPKATNSNYLYESSPALNGEYLELQKHERDTQATTFIEVFGDTYDCDLQMGDNEEEDNLFVYCKERPLLRQEFSEQSQPPQDILSSTHEVLGSRVSMQIKSNSQAKNADALDRKRLHCWVLVTTNKRDVSDCFFLEPSTGHRYELQSSPYQAVEYIWNQHNIFINMQLNANRSGLENMSWDLKDTAKWERVLDTFLSSGDLQEPILASNTKVSNSTLSPGKRQDVHMPNVVAGLVINTDTSKLESGSLSPLNVSTDSSAGLTSKAIIKAGGSVGLSKDGIDKMSLEDPMKNGFTKPYHWLLPSSWVTHLKIPIDAYVTRCPKGVKKTHYYRCTHELYSFYGDSVRWDGLIERVILYEDDERTNVFEIHDYFQRRKDGLRKRTFIPGANKVIGKNIVETSTNHEACLVYRCACYGPPLPPPRDEYSPKPLSERHLESVNGMLGETSVKGSISRPGSVRLSSRPISHGRLSVDSQKGRSRSRMMSRWQGSSSNRRKNSTPTSDKQNEKKLLPVPRRKPVAEKLLPIVKITQKYELRSDACPKGYVAKHVFKLSINQIKVDYHHVNRHITANSHVYNKDGSLSLIQLPTDYLSPFLPPGVRPRQKLTRQQMLDVRDSCLKALKERLVNRATIIQTRYDEETSALSKRRTNFERDREQMTVEDEETYNLDCENALFKIRILEFRAKQHEEEALKKYLELEKKLQNDPRLARLYRATSA